MRKGSYFRNRFIIIYACHRKQECQARGEKMTFVKLSKELKLLGHYLHTDTLSKILKKKGVSFKED